MSPVDVNHQEIRGTAAGALHEPKVIMRAGCASIGTGQTLEGRPVQVLIQRARLECGGLWRARVAVLSVAVSVVVRVEARASQTVAGRLVVKVGSFLAVSPAYVAQITARCTLLYLVEAHGEVPTVDQFFAGGNGMTNEVQVSSRLQDIAGRTLL